MADAKISQLTIATTPLAGTEVLPIVQSGTTVKVAVSDLTAGRAVSMLSLVADTTTLVVDSTNRRTGVGTATPSKKLNVIIDAVAGRQNLDAVSRTAQNLLTFTNPEYSTDASMGIMFRSFPQSDARQGAGIFASGGTSNDVTDLNLFVSGLGGADVSYSAVNIEGVDGNVTVRKGNLVIGTAGKGIDFSATTEGSGTMTSELLDDYEEGTWTPSLGGDTTYFHNYGSYVKVGRQVTVTGFLYIDAIGTGSTTTLSGLPFTSENTYQKGCLSIGEVANLAVNVTSLQGQIAAIASTISFFGFTAAASGNTPAVAIFQNQTVLYFAATYIASA